ncbi:hypothetical protein FA893_06775 [Photobacterium damselae subsp. piscicida]|uniref:Uncharacterized protein n=1 Tax=Photobacterium damselae subsp. damselae TaxID=85581 RepID=A0A850R594_PHODD|nr:MULTISPECIES: hypothetical protein [Gammaproteobacteria]EGQ9994044.1 hypothetical protein [Vibrio vulnificus]NVP02131.1 hypothetical protein [Photobacterium damselae subsp. damselae]EHH0795896.1 hypothetical protein [Vibrio vulnificus]MBO2579145.1 hypothetical protein [Shewanella algae]MBO2684629.1 hypothetical protein [Shewanella algae]
MIPDFDSTGNLPEGIHLASMEELVERFGYNPKRAWLIDGLKLLICALQKANCPLVYIDGSFVTSKEIPGDYDLCWSLVDVIEEKVDPVLLDFSPTGRATMEQKYRGDIFPAELPEGGSGKLFVDFFQTDKNTGEKKGIVAIKIGGSL